MSVAAAGMAGTPAAVLVVSFLSFVSFVSFLQQDPSAEAAGAPAFPEVRAHCVYPCRCGTRPPSCSPGVPLVRDGCGCCLLCAGQRGDPCDGARLCDEASGVVCQYAGSAPTGICRAIKGRPCFVENETYDNGETFMLDCRTQCACQNGTYACASLCPQESISPRGFSCKRPRLVELPGQCCREWMCDSNAAETPPECPRLSSAWTPCSRTCGLGLSARMSNQNPGCVAVNETRPCQLRPCLSHATDTAPLDVKTRRGHSCKATVRAARPARLRLGRCLSKRRYRPKHCGDCRTRGLCCAPRLSSSIKVEFECDGPTPPDASSVAELGVNMWESDAPYSLRTTPASATESDKYNSLGLVGNSVLKQSEEDEEDVEEDEDEEDVEGENEEGHRYSKSRQGRLWSVFSVRSRSRRKHTKTTAFFEVQWITKCECFQCAVTEAAPQRATRAIARIKGDDVILHRVHRTTPS